MGAGLSPPGATPSLPVNPPPMVRRVALCLSCRADGPRLDELFLTDGPCRPRPRPRRRRGAPRGFFRRLRENMRKTREALAAEVQATLFEGDLDEETWERLEEALIYADVGARTTAQVVEQLEREAEEGGLVGGEQLTARLAELLAAARPHRRRHDRHPPRPDRDPRRRRQRHRQDDDDRQARLAPAQHARQDRRGRRRRHVPRRRRRAARALGRARGRRRRQGPGGLGPRRRGLRRGRPRARARRRRRDRRHRRAPAHAARPDGRARRRSAA